MTTSTKPLPSDRVALVQRAVTTYPAFPYLPGERYPELARRVPTTDDANPVFEMVRRSFRLLGLDRARYGTSAWNPLGTIIRPGMRVLVKPNWVREFNAGSSDDTACMYTHPSVIRAVLEYVFLALTPRAGDRPTGEVVVGDAPLQSCNLPLLLAESGMSRLAGHLKADGKPITIRDFRLTLWRDGIGTEGGDPTGYTFVDLGSESLHAPRDAEYRRYRVACYDPRLMRRRHAPGRHEYLIANSVLDADVVVNLPKLKTHKKSGVTGGLKNYVGIVGHKEFLPHHVKGSPENGGDEYEAPSRLKAMHSSAMDLLYGPVVARSRPLRYLTGRGVELLRSAMRHGGGSPLVDGSWHGNDTLWRTILDLNRAVLYYDKERAEMAGTPVRRQLVLVDAIVAGEGNGPLAPDPRPFGAILAGESPLSVDATIASVIGFDIDRIAKLVHGVEIARWPITRLVTPHAAEVVADLGGRDRDVALGLQALPTTPLEPPVGWSKVRRDLSRSHGEGPSVPSLVSVTPSGIGECK